MTNRPAGIHEAAETFSGVASSLNENVDKWQELAAHVNGAFAALVETRHGNYRRRLYLTLAAAEAAAHKAQDAGRDAVVVLCELKPLYKVEGAPPEQLHLGRIVDAATGGVAI